MSPRARGGWRPSRRSLRDRYHGRQVFSATGNPESGACPRRQRHAHGVTFDQDAGPIADTHYSAIGSIPEGELLTEWGTYGPEPGNFIYPTDIARHPDGRSYISEYGMDADRVQVFDAGKTFLFAFGKFGSGPGEFSRAMAIEVFGDLVYVCDTVNHRVQIFDLDGAFVRQVGQTGGDGHRMKYPYDAATLPDGGILACEYGNNCVSHFDASVNSAGVTAVRDGLGQFHGPRGVAVSARQGVRGRHRNHRIQVFTWA